MITPEICCRSISEIFEAEAMPHFTVLMRIALNLMRNRNEAEDLVQETFTQALKSFDRYTPGTNCRAWLCKIMLNKRAQRMRLLRQHFSEFDESATSICSPGKTVLPRDFLSGKLLLAFNELPLKNRQVVWLSEVEEFSYREISNLLDIPIGTVMSRLSRGRKMLRHNYHVRTAFSDHRPTTE